jgi:hypothetical protein
MLSRWHGYKAWLRCCVAHEGGEKIRGEQQTTKNDGLLYGCAKAPAPPWVSEVAGIRFSIVYAAFLGGSPGDFQG